MPVSALAGAAVRSYVSVPLTSPDDQLLGALCGLGRAPHGDELLDALPTVEVSAGMLGTLLSHELRSNRR